MKKQIMRTAYQISSRPKNEKPNIKTKMNMHGKLLRDYNTDGILNEQKYLTN